MTQTSTSPDRPAIFADFEAWVEEHGGRVVPTGGGKVGIMPSEYFDEKDRPDVDPMLGTIEEDGERVVTVPLVWAYPSVTGIQLLAPEHVAYTWVTMTEQELLEEYKLRRRYDSPLPPIVKRAVNKHVGDSRA